MTKNISFIEFLNTRLSLIFINNIYNSKIPIIGLSADAFDETKRKVLEIGMNDFLTKPIQTSTVILT